MGASGQSVRDTSNNSKFAIPFTSRNPDLGQDRDPRPHSFYPVSLLPKNSPNADIIDFAYLRKNYIENTHLHAVHDKDLLKKAGDGGDEMLLNYCQKYLSEKVMTRLKAGAFSSLCIHLRERSDVVQNIELMTISGFCRNCLAKVRAFVLFIH